MINSLILVGLFIALPTAFMFMLVSILHVDDEPHLKRALEVREAAYQIEDEA